MGEAQEYASDRFQELFLLVGQGKGVCITLWGPFLSQSVHGITLVTASLGVGRWPNPVVLCPGYPLESAGSF